MNTNNLSVNFDWAKDYVVSANDAKKIANPTWIIPNLIISSHIVLIPAEPNAGKTTILFHLSSEMVKQGYEVFYVNSDISGGDAKPMIDEAQAKGFTLMLPDLVVGKSMNSVIDDLERMSESNTRFDNKVFIFDTLKKMINTMVKDHAKKLFQILRKLTAKGMTIILLAHTNKYYDKEGNPIYEGTGDMRSDVDELIYLIPQKHNDGTMTVTTKPDKVRGTFKPISFKIDSNRQVAQLLKSIDTKTAVETATKIANDQPTIKAITSAINNGCITQKDIIEHCKVNDSISERIVKKTLCEYEKNANHKLWIKEKGTRNSSKFKLVKS